MSDTYERSLAHWSDASRDEMEKFYELASYDYRILAESWSWVDWLSCDRAQTTGHPPRLLDVACGSGKFPSALQSFGGVNANSVSPIICDLLDPASFSISETRRVLRQPFIAGESFELPVQQLSGVDGRYDFIWSTHGLYAVSPAEIDVAIERLALALDKSGKGFIAHAGHDAHYLRFYRSYLDGFRDGEGTPYLSGEQVRAALERHGLRVEHHDVRYENHAEFSELSAVEGYLQRCLFDDTVTLSSMLENEATGAYLRACRTPDGWRFGQTVFLLFFEHQAAS